MALKRKVYIRPGSHLFASRSNSWGKISHINGGKFSQPNKDPDGEIEKSGEKHEKSRISNFCYIQNIVFDLAIYLVGYLPWLSTSGSGWDLASPQPLKKCEK